MIDPSINQLDLASFSITERHPSPDGVSLGHREAGPGARALSIVKLQRWRVIDQGCIITCRLCGHFRVTKRAYALQTGGGENNMSRGYMAGVHETSSSTTSPPPLEDHSAFQLQLVCGRTQKKCNNCSFTCPKSSLWQTGNAFKLKLNITDCFYFFCALCIFRDWRIQMAAKNMNFYSQECWNAIAFNTFCLITWWVCDDLK